MNLPTYRIGLVQAQAYRQLQQSFHTALKPFDLTIPEWSLLGIIYDEGNMTLTRITEILKSKASHPTVLVDRLVARGLLQRNSTADDRRVKIVSITARGRELVPEVERSARAKLAGDLVSLERADLLEYLRLLQKIAEITPK